MNREQIFNKILNAIQGIATATIAGTEKTFTAMRVEIKNKDNPIVEIVHEPSGKKFAVAIYEIEE